MTVERVSPAARRPISASPASVVGLSSVAFGRSMQRQRRRQGHPIYGVCVLMLFAGNVLWGQGRGAGNARALAAPFVVSRMVSTTMEAVPVRSNTAAMACVAQATLFATVNTPTGSHAVSRKPSFRRYAHAKPGQVYHCGQALPGCCTSSEAATATSSPLPEA
ncbi:MAG TPA: hypothetical protein VFI46_02600 [Jiangellaceae bacterium]|nr:hypothetical protein [Jiangellaceae bacterium]